MLAIDADVDASFVFSLGFSPLIPEKQRNLEAFLTWFRQLPVLVIHDIHTTEDGRKSGKANTKPKVKIQWLQKNLLG
jgi:hypothetical protein